MKKLSIFLVLTTILISGCTLSIGNSQPPAVAGVFKSFDKGSNWLERNFFLYSSGTGSIAGVNVISLVMDPQDTQAFYLKTDGSGLLYSYDGGDSWQQVKQIGSGRIESVAVDPKNKCVIYSTFANTVLKTVDCGRSWTEVYIDTRADNAVTALAVDTFSNLIVYAGNSAGDILKSVNGGGNWRVIHRFNNPVAKLLIDSNDTRIIYAATSGKGIFKTTNGGESWIDINTGLKQYSGSTEYKDLIFDETLPNSLLLVAKYGLIKTIDGGETWQALNLITPPATTDIFSVAISPANNQEIYYATASTFYKTTDGGQNWVTTRLPTGAVATDLLIDPLNPSIIYMGMANLGR